MKIIQVIPHICNESSGPTYYMLNLCKALGKCDVVVETHSLVEAPRVEGFKTRVYPQHRFPMHGLGRSPEMLKRLREVAQTSDIIHNNSLWMMPNVYAYWAAKGSKAKIVTSPHGTLSPWALQRGRLRKKIFGGLLQYPALRMTDLFHATCEKEYNEIRAAGYKQPVAIIPIGMDIPKVSARDELTLGGFKKVAFFGRIHKVKGVDNLLVAWGKIAAQHPNWELVFAGPDGGMVETLKNIIAEQKIERVRFAGEINGDKKYDFLSSIDLYVLPSHTENFGVTVAEALACGTPVIASKHTPWGGVVENRCGWCVSNDVGTLAATLDEAMSLPQETLKGMGVRGREWIRRDFSWEKVGRTMLSAYEWLCRGGERPTCVRVD